MSIKWRFGEGNLPRSEGYYWFVAIGIIFSWVVVYVAMISVFLSLAPEKGAAPRSSYIISMLGGLTGPLVFLWTLWARNNRSHREVKNGGKTKPS